MYSGNKTTFLPGRTAHTSSKMQRILVASEGKEQVGRTDTAEECDEAGTADEQDPIPVEELRYREWT